MKRIVLAILFSAATALPMQLFSFGVKGGVPLNDAFNAASNGQISYVTHNQHWTVGPEFDLNLPFGLGIEVDALYRRLNYNSSGNLVDELVQRSTTANAWDVPLLLKWRFWPGPVRPYVSVGPTFRGITNLNQRVQTFFSPSRTETAQTSQPAEFQDRFNTGFTLSGGLQLGTRALRVSPEIRYVRWGWDTFRSTQGLLKSNPDEVQFLLGITF